MVPCGRDGAPHTKREIAALELAGAPMIGELLGERAMRLIGLGDDQQSAGILVEPMHDAGPRHAADAGEARAAMGDQRVDQRAGGVAGAGMHHEARGLVDDDERVVLVDDVEGDGLACGLRRCGGRHAKLEAVARFDPVFRLHYGRPAQGNLALFDQALHAGAAQLRQLRREKAVEPLPFGAGIGFRGEAA